MPHKSILDLDKRFYNFRLSSKIIPAAVLDRPNLNVLLPEVEILYPPNTQLSPLKVNFTI